MLERYTYVFSNHYNNHMFFRPQLNDDDAYSADYAAIFNIILWFGVVFAFSLIAIVYALIDMDPGRDSIIYRMTSTRMKKDN